MWALTFEPKRATFLIVLLILAGAFIPPPTAMVGGAFWHTGDIVYLGILANLVYRPPSLKRYRSIKPIYVCLLIFTVMVLFNLARGLFIYSNPREVLNEFRMYFYMVISFWYLSSIEVSYEDLLQIARQCVIVSGVLLLIVIFRYGLVLSGRSAGEISDLASKEGVRRVLLANHALFIALTVMIGWCLAAIKALPAWGKWVVWLLPFAVIVLQHRSVWLAFGVMLVMAALWGLGIKRYATRFLQVGLILVVSILMFSPHSLLGGDLAKSAETITGRDSTLAWREQGWVALLEPSNVSSPMVYVVGEPMGYGFRRLMYVGRRRYWEDVSAHNLYVELLLRSGVIGITAFLVMMVLLIVKIWRLGQVGRTIAITLVGLLVYSMAYNFDSSYSIFFGLGALLAKCRSPLVSRQGAEVYPIKLTSDTPRLANV
jgi:hypothetical protein